MRRFLTMLAVVFVASSMLYAQKQVVVVQDYFSTGQEGTLNAAVTAAINGGTLSNTIFKLQPYGTYVLSGTITTPPGQTLEIDADPPGTTQATAPPMICWTASTAPSKTYLFDIAGELDMKNVWILWASLDGTRYSSTIRIGDSATVSGGRCHFENVMFDDVQQASSGAVQPFATHFVGTFKNCYFRNATDNHFRYYSRAVSVPFAATGIHTDSVSFENCTFANIGYVYMQEAANYGDNVHFNHCTFYNVVMYSLESGWWWKMYVTNSLFINTYMFGWIPATGGADNGAIGISFIDSTQYGAGFGFTVPFTEQDRRILFANNDYWPEQWLLDWMAAGPNGSPYSNTKHQNREDDLIPVPQPMFNSTTRLFFDSTDAAGHKIFPYINRANLDSLGANFVNPPINLDSLKTFLNKKWDDNSDIPWGWKTWLGYGQVWPLQEDLSYTNATLKTAAMGGYPLGDLYHWWPTQYAQWNAQADAERTRITTWLETGQDPNGPNAVNQLPGAIPSKYTLDQNYPNPFNPTTLIKYSVPKQAFVSLKVYNTVGEVVRTLFEGQQGPGNYAATFDATDLASGVYFYRLESGTVSITKKLVLMK